MTRSNMAALYADRMVPSTGLGTLPGLTQLKGLVGSPLSLRVPARNIMQPTNVVTRTDSRVLADEVSASVAEQAPPVELTSAEQDRLAVEAALHGNQLAFADLVSRYQTAVYNMAYRMLGDPTEAEDAAQEVFVRAWNQLHSFQLDRRFSTWLLSIASHLCIDLLRRRKPSAPLDDVALYVRSEEPEPDEIALQGEQRDLVKRLLDTLPEKYRSVTVLRYFNDMSYDEIAQATGLTESAVKTQLHRARKMLAEGYTRVAGPDDQRSDNQRSVDAEGDGVHLARSEARP
ncbi:MAG: sigma-70 family RNA polymerase sigma factor [Chloroflexota bacterium]|nr:sigma-70 family RNA polymerase sigma factor [Chloroflexota bacterium]